MRWTFARPLKLLAPFLAAAALLASPALTQPTEDAFTRRIAERFRASLPDRTVEIAGPLQLRISGKPEPAEVNVGRIFNYCRARSAEDCEKSIATFVSRSADSFRVASEPVTRARLRVAVRNSDYCDYIAREPRFREKSRSGPLMRPFATGLCTLIMADFPTMTRTVTIEDLEELKLEPQSGWALAEEQTLAELPGPKTLEGLDKGGALVGDFDYAPSIMLAAEGWRAAAADGEILVAVPGASGAIVMRRKTLGDLPAFRKFIREEFETAERGISPHVYRWTDKGWVALAD